MATLLSRRFPQHCGSRTLTMRAGELKVRLKTPIRELFAEQDASKSDVDHGSEQSMRSS